MPSDRVERDASAPVQQADAQAERVDLVGLLSDEFGISRSVARMDLLTAKPDGVTLDGEPVEEALAVPREGNVGKTLEVQGGSTNRTYRVQIQ